MRPAQGADLIHPPKPTPVGGQLQVLRSGDLDQPKLRQRGHAVVKADLLYDLAVEHLQHRRAGEVHLAAGRSREAANQKVVEGWTGMGAPTFPLTDDVVALGDQIRRAPEIEIGNAVRKSVMNALMSS
jgi:hypothetical protein